MKRLIDIQAKLKAPKNQFNKFGNFKYRTCEDILEGVKPLLKQEEVSLIINDEIMAINERYYIKAIASLYDNEGKLIAQAYAYAREEESKKGMDASQITGATSSYARKYALNGLFAIDDTKDADTINKDKEKEKNKEILPSPSLVDEDLVYKTLRDCKTIKSLNIIFNKYKDQIIDIKKFQSVYTEIATSIKRRNSYGNNN